MNEGKIVVKLSTTRWPIHYRMFRWLGLLLPGVLCLGCGGPAPLTADMPLHLEDHVAEARVIGSDIPEHVPQPLEWRFDQPQPDWKATPPWNKNPPARLTGTADGLLVTLTDAMRNPAGDPQGGIYIDVPDFERADWDHVVIRARSENEISSIGVGFNLREGSGASTDWPGPHRDWEGGPVIRDGTVQTYRFQTDLISGRWEGPWQQLGLWFGSNEPGSIEVLSVSLVSKAAAYAEAPHGVKNENRDGILSRTLYTHAPGRVEYPVLIPDGGRLDLGLGVVTGGVPVTFRVTATNGNAPEEILLEEVYDDATAFAIRSIDLSHLTGKVVTLALEADSDSEGAVALWATPTVSEKATASRPNIIFYVIDGAGADFMSVYGYNRRTTPNLERIAAEGAVFQYARSNSAWTKPSTASFMTSLQHSVLGGFHNPQDALPDSVVTMAQHLHRAGYQTAVFTTNPNAGSLSDLQRGVDVFRDRGMRQHSISSVELHRNFWDWRSNFPGAPYWVHFQTTDVHEMQRPVAPFAGLFVQRDARDSLHGLWDRNWDECEFEEWEVSISGFMRRCLETIGVDPLWYFDTQRGLYDETMAHQDYQLGRLVERLKADGEWENTLLIIASDHGHPAGSFSRFGRGLFDPPPPDWEGALADSYRTRIPLIFVWPGHIVPGQRFSQRVSMIDMLPTVLDLVDLPPPEVMQGQSLAPLLFGTDGWEERPVILEQLQNDVETGEFTGHIEVIDGWWAASLEIWPERAEGDPPVEPSGYQRAARPHWPDTPRLLLYDLRSDPFTLANVNEEYPELVEHYTRFLEAQWEAHQVLRQHVGGSTAEVALTPEQLETLRALGYID